MADNIVKAEYLKAIDEDTNTEVLTQFIPPEPLGTDRGGITQEEYEKLLKSASADDVSQIKEGKINKPTVADNNKMARANNGEVEWVDVGQPTDEQTDSAVSKWLNEHPEATTTVQNGSIIESKISNAFLPYIKNIYVTPEMFGAVGDGKNDDTISIQNAINANKMVVLCGKYKITSSITLNIYQRIKSYGAEIISDGSFTAITIIGHADKYNYSKLDNAIISGDLSINGADIGILLDGRTSESQMSTYVKGIKFVRCKTGLKIVAYNAYGIEFDHLWFASCDIGVHYSLNSGKEINSNERIQFSRIMSGNCKEIFRFDTACTLYIKNSSLDYSGLGVNVLKGRGNVFIEQCHIEGLGDKNRVYSTYKGGFHFEDSSSKVHIIQSEIVYIKNTLDSDFEFINMGRFITDGCKFNLERDSDDSLAFLTGGNVFGSHRNMSVLSSVGIMMPSLRDTQWLFNPFFTSASIPQAMTVNSDSGITIEAIDDTTAYVGKCVKFTNASEIEKKVTIMFDRHEYIAQSQYILTSIFKGDIKLRANVIFYGDSGNVIGTDYDTYNYSVASDSKDKWFSPVSVRNEACASFKDGNFKVPVSAKEFSLKLIITIPGNSISYLQGFFFSFK